MRRLSECKKVCSCIRDAVLPVLVYSPVRKVTFLNNHRLDKNYDMSSGVKRSLEVSYLLNSIVHSYVFVVQTADDETAQSIYVSSDAEGPRALER